MFYRLVFVALAAVFAGASLAQEYPARPIRVVIPFAAGGVSDLIVRAFSEPLGKALGQPIVADNRGGAGGTVAAGQVAAAAHDGYTLMLGNGGNLAVAPSLYKDLTYAPEKAFTPIAMVARAQLVLVVPPSFPASSVAELIRLAKSKPDQLTYASSGMAAGPHLAAELLKSLADIRVVHIPFKGSSPMLTALIGGQVDMGFDSVATALPQVRAGRLKALAVSGASRTPLAADIPTMEQAGVPGYAYSSYFVLVAPAAVPAAIVGRLSKEVARITEGAEFRAQIEAMGLEAAPLVGPDLDRYLRNERAQWASVISAAGIKVD